MLRRAYPERPRTMSPTPASSRQPGRRRATVAMGFVTGMLHGFARQGRDARVLLSAAGIDLADTASRIPVERYAHLYNLVVADLQDEGFGLLPRPLPPGTFEFLCRGMLGAPTLADALDRAVRFLRIALPDLRVEFGRDENRAELRIIEMAPLAAVRADPGRVFALEWLLRLLHGVASWFVGRGLALDEVDFPYPRPPHADDYALVYTEHSRFEVDHDEHLGAPDTPDCLRARFQANLLDLPLRRDEAALAAFLQGAPGKIAMLYRRDREMVLRVRDLLRDALPASPTLDEIAARLHVSPRTLARRLDEEGSGFRAIKDALRRDMAYARLTKTRQSIGELANDLGYADPSAFYRAFVSWAGVSPERFRGRLAPGQVARRG